MQQTSTFFETGHLVNLRDICNKIATLFIVRAFWDDASTKIKNYTASLDPYRFPSKLQHVVLMGIFSELKPLSFPEDPEANRKLL